MLILCDVPPGNVPSVINRITRCGIAVADGTFNVYVPFPPVHCNSTMLLSPEYVELPPGDATIIVGISLAIAPDT